MYLAACALLEATGRFGGVLYGLPPKDVLLGADVFPLAVVAPGSFAETDDVDPIQLLRVCVGQIHVVHRDQDPRARTIGLDNLGQAAANALNGKSLAETTIPRLTTVAGGVYEPPDHPNQTLRLEFRFAYLVEGDDGRDDD